MIDLTAKAKAVCDILAYVTGLPANKLVVGYPNAGSPAGSYGTVVCTGQDAFGQAMKSQQLIPGVTSPIGIVDDIRDFTKTQVVLTFSINFYREKSNDYMGAIQEANKRHPVFMKLRAAKLGWFRLGPVQNLTGLFAANSELRFQRNLYLTCEDVVSDTVQAIYDVEYAVSVDSEPDLAEGSVNVLPG